MILMINAPATGTATSHAPRWVDAGDAGEVLQRWRKNRFVKRAISFSSAHATHELTSPIPIARNEMALLAGRS